MKMADKEKHAVRRRPRRSGNMQRLLLVILTVLTHTNAKLPMQG